MSRRSRSPTRLTSAPEPCSSTPKPRENSSCSAIAAVLGRDGLIGADDAATTARIVTAITFLSMAVSQNAALSIEAIVQDIRTQISLLMPR
jgi:hypothetical protein